MTKRFILFFTLALFAGYVNAQELSLPDLVDPQDTLLAETDTLIADTPIPDPDPEWYVAPISYDSLMARHKVLRRAASDCPIDSVLTFDEVSVLTYVSIYEHGDTTRTITWRVNPDGSREGNAKKENANDGLHFYGATYKWDYATNNWKGESRADTVYNDAHKNVSRTIYTWLNNAWIPQTHYTYEYDAAGRVSVFTTYTLGANNQLVLSKQMISEWYNASKKTLEINYTSYTNGNWTAGTKKEYIYNASGTQIEYTYYASLISTDNWGGDNSTHEVWEYSGSNKTKYEKQIWANGAFVNSQKELWAFNSSNRQILYEKYSWINEDWAITNHDTVGFDALGNKVLDAKYTITNGVWNGKKTEYLFSGKTGIGNISYKWVASKNDFDPSVWTVQNNHLGDTIENCKYTWNNGWVGNGNRTLSITQGGQTDLITQTWSTDIWVNSTLKTTIKSSGKTTQEASFKWQNDEWIGTARKDWHYNTAGLDDTIKTYRPIGSVWVDSLRTVKTYSGSTLIMTHNAKWDGLKWVMQTMTRTDIVDRIVDGIRQELEASWQCGSDSVWIGVKKDTFATSATNKSLYEAHFTSWANNEWIPSTKLEFTYDASDNLVAQQKFRWEGSAFVGVYRYEYGFDDQGRQDVSASYNGWDKSKNTWIGSTKTIKTFYGNTEKEDTSILFTWGTTMWQPLFRNVYTYDNSLRTIMQIVEHYEGGMWVNSGKYINEYKGNIQVKNNAYMWINNQWMFSSRNEQYYDDDAQAKLRRKVIGSWNEGEKISFADDHYFYDCDYPYYTIRFENYDGTLLQSSSVKETKIPVYKGATPTKPATSQYTYTFKGWDKEIVAVTGNATYIAVYDSTANKFTITYKNYDESLLQSSEVAYGVMPEYTGTTPTKQAEGQYSYVFSGWTPEVVPVTGNATYRATFTAVTDGYTITWLNENGSLIDQTIVIEDVVPTHADPVKQSTAEFTYTFAGWTPEIVAATANATYKATFTATKNSYTITWQNEDGSEMDQTTVEYGATPTHTDPTKAATAEYTYTFTGWTPEVATVTGNATYKATFNATKNSYLITWQNEDGSEIDSETLAYGALPTHADPVKQNTAEYTYTFTGWTPEVATVTCNATYKATFSATKNSYLITWQNEDGSEINQTTVEYGVMPTHDDPVKQNTAEYTYTFTGWTPELTTVTGNATYKATFSATKNSYTITWQNEDGSEIDHVTLEYGATPTHEDPVKQNTAEYTYAFTGWTPEVTTVTGNATYQATFSATKNSYLITWQNEDGSAIDSETLEYGVMPTHDDPVKQNTAEYTYTFTGWTPEVATVTGNATYQATFSATKNSYLITWQNEDGTEMDSETLEYGVMPTHDDPTKAATAEYTYTFAGWTPEVETVSGVATYRATFTATKNNYLITFKNYDGTVLLSNEVEYGQIPAYEQTPEKPATAQYTYTFKGWTPELAEVSGEATYVAEYDSTLNSYTVIFYYEDGVTELERQTVAYGEMPNTELVPSIPGDAQYTYIFAGWSPEIVPVTGDASYTATYERIVNQYTITFKNYNGQVLQSMLTDYGTMPEYTGETPARQGNVQYSYIFTGWTPEVTTVTGEATYTAVFESEVNTYTVTFYDEDGVTVLDEVEVAYGQMPSTDVVPTKEDDDQYRYTFAGWTPALAAVTGDTSYRATYTATDKHESLSGINADVPATKIMINGIFYIRRGDKLFTLDGVVVE